MSISKLPSLDNMERIPHTELPNKLDWMMERIDQTNVGFVITENGQDKYVLCPYDWFDFSQDDDFGCMINSAIRNALRSNSEDTEAVQRFVMKHCDSFDLRTLSVAVEDIERFFHFGQKQLEIPHGWEEVRMALSKQISIMENYKGGNRCV